MGNWKLGFGLLCVAMLNRVILSIVTGWGVVRDSGSLRFCWLYPVRDLLGFLLWCASFWGSEIVWRGERYQLIAGGKMAPKSGLGRPAPKSPDGCGVRVAATWSVTIDRPSLNFGRQ